MPFKMPFCLEGFIAAFTHWIFTFSLTTIFMSYQTVFPIKLPHFSHLNSGSLTTYKFSCVLKDSDND